MTENNTRAKYNLRYYEKNKERLVKENYLRSLAAKRVKSPRESTLTKYGISRQEAEEILGQKN